MNYMNKNLFPLLTVLLILLLLLSLFANIRLILFSRASGGGADYSVENSYLFASPIEAQANNVDKIRITVFVLSSQGRGVANKQVLLNKAPELVIEQINSLTDNYGRAVFDLITNQAGEYMIEANVDNHKLGEGIKIIFN